MSLFWKFWSARKNFLRATLTWIYEFLRILSSFRSTSEISGSRQTKSFQYHKVYDQNITNFNIRKSKNTNFWNFEKSHFSKGGGASRVNFFTYVQGFFPYPPPQTCPKPNVTRAPPNLIAPACLGARFGVTMFLGSRFGITF